MDITPVIMCGGAGTRLWPSSRESFPKHLLSMAGGLSTFQRTVARFQGAQGFGAQGFGRPVVITSADSRFLVGEQLAAIGAAADVILEPSRQDSAAAVAVGALHCARRDPAALCFILAADHVVEDASAFREAARRSARAAAQGFVMTLGVRPTHPAAGYGYLAPGEAIAGEDTGEDTGAGAGEGSSGAGSFRLKAFKEKPDAAAAARYIQDGYLWNSGNFLFPPSVMIEELEAFAPAVLAAARQAYAQASHDADFIRLDAASFAQAPKTSIDFAVMERTARAGVTPYDGDWSDIGTWDAYWEASPKDAHGNALCGDAHAIGSRDSLVHADGLLAAVVGVEDLVVVAARDAVLVTTRARSGEVKAMVAALRQAGRKEADEHNRMHRPWGWYQRIDIGPRFQAKRIHVQPGGRLSLQKHHHRAEHWVVVQGAAEVTIDGQVSILRENESIHLPQGCVHRMANPGRIPLEIVEVQIGSYTGEDDIVRIEDVYGR